MAGRADRRGKGEAVRIRVLGASGSEVAGHHCPAFAVDGQLLLDAGTIGVSLTIDEEQEIRYILLTHAHLDHVSGVAAAKQAFQVPVHLHEADQFLYERVAEQGKMFGFSVPPQPAVDVYYDLTPIRFGDYRVGVHHTPGHSPGGVTLHVEPVGTAAAGAQTGAHLFVGDALFAGSIGRTDLPGGDYGTLMRSITEVIFPLGLNAVVHPGHGPDTTVERERSTNPFVLEYLGRA